MKSTIKIVGDAAVLTSAVKMEDWEKVLKYRPEATTLKDEDGDTVFVVAAKDGVNGRIGKYGVIFDSTSRDADKLAQITKLIPANVEDVREWALETFADVKSNLDKIEGAIPTVLAEINAEHREFLDNLTIV